MNKVIKSLIVSLFLLFSTVGLVGAQVPSPSPTPGPVSSFDMFWPISAGKVSGERFYGLKLFKEKLREGIIFSDYKKADYNITLSVKRVVEAEKLYLTDRKYEEGKKTLKMAQEKRERVKELIKKVSDKGQSSTDLKNAFKSSLEKQTALEKYMHSQVSDSEKGAIDEDIKSIEKLTSEL